MFILSFFCNIYIERDQIGIIYIRKLLSKVSSLNKLAGKSSAVVSFHLEVLYVIIDRTDFSGIKTVCLKCINVKNIRCLCIR